MGIAQLQHVFFFLIFFSFLGAGGGGVFSLLRLSEEQDKGASVSNREMKRVDAHFQIESKLGEIKPRFDNPFHFLLSRPRVEDGSAQIIKNIIGGPM